MVSQNSLMTLKRMSFYEKLLPYLIMIIFIYLEKKRFVKRSASAPGEISYSVNDVKKLDIDDYDMNFIKYDDKKLVTLESENEELKLIHHFGEMGFRMEDVLEAIDEVQCTDFLTILNHITSGEN